MDLIGYGLLAFAVLNLFNSHTGGSKRDRRFKTGYKNNDTPSYIPFESRLLLSGLLGLVGAAILWPKIVLGVAAAGIAAYFLVPSIEKWVNEQVKSARKDK